MLKYVLLRLLAMIPLLFVVLFIVFSLGHLAPGDPVEMMYVNVALEQSTVTEEQKQEVRHRYGLDQPFFVQFGAYVQRLAQGDFGNSITQSRPVLPMILKVFLPVFLLMLFPLAVVIRQMRASVLEVLSTDYVRTARAKGLRERQVVIVHIMRNALTPVVTEFGLIVTGLITGSVFLETIFG